MVANRVQRRNYRKLTASYRQVRKGERRERGRGGEGGDERKGERRERGILRISQRINRGLGNF